MFVAHLAFTMSDASATKEGACIAIPQVRLIQSMAIMLEYVSKQAFLLPTSVDAFRMVTSEYKWCRNSGVYEPFSAHPFFGI